MIKKNLTHLHVIVTKQTYWKVRHWAEEKPAESGEYIVQIKYGKYAATLLYEKDTDEWWDHDPEYGTYKIVKWQPLPEV